MQGAPDYGLPFHPGVPLRWGTHRSICSAFFCAFMAPWLCIRPPSFCSLSLHPALHCFSRFPSISSPLPWPSPQLSSRSKPLKASSRSRKETEGEGEKGKRDLSGPSSSALLLPRCINGRSRQPICAHSAAGSETLSWCRHTQLSSLLQ